MTIYKTFANRNRPRPDKLVYDELPEDLREHCVRVLREGLGSHTEVLDVIDSILKRETPTPSFASVRRRREDDYDDDTRFFEDAIVYGDFFEAMSAIEVAAFFINTETRKLDPAYRSIYRVKTDPDHALEELNGRFVQAGVGYQFSKEQGRLVRIDSAFMHAEVTAPATALLMEKGFEGAAQEFQKAHEHYRLMAQDPEAGKDAVAWAVKAVESTAKAIMDARGWTYGNGDTIVPLLDKLFSNGLVPTELQSLFGGLRSALTSGLPTIGNRQARHGQGAAPKPIEEHMVTLGMHLAASAIRFLVEAHKAKE
jgi:hypothetical protein